MPYLQVDLDALDAFADVATMTKMSVGEACHGLLRLWRHCWKGKTAYVTRERLMTFFPGDAETVERALVACEFIDLPGHRPDIHVRGAEKRLGLLEQQTSAGKRRTATAKRDSKGRLMAASEHGVRTSSANPADNENVQRPLDSGPAPAGEPSSARPAADLLLHPTSNIQHPTVKYFAGTSPEVPRPKSQKAKKAKEADPAHAPLTRRLGEEFLRIRGVAYGHLGGKDAKAITRLLQLSSRDMEEVVRRWGTGLTSVGWQRCSSFHDLANKWNDLTGETAVRDKRPPDAVVGRGSGPPELNFDPNDPWAEVAP